MRYIFTVFSFAVAFFASTQETKKMTVKHENPWFTEKYMVLKSDQKVKHGSYKKLGYKNCLLINGYYQNGLKDSIWTEYFWRSKILKSQGRYENDQKNGLWLEYFQKDDQNILKNKGNYDDGKRIGTWEFFNRKDELIQRFNYDTKEVLFFKTDTIVNYDVKTSHGIEKMKLDRPPLYIGGTFEASTALLEIDLRYPQKAIEEEISGTVLISFFVDKNGVAIDHAIHEGIGGGCDEEALRVVKELPNNWLPGIINGEPVIAKYIYKVKFSFTVM